MKDWRAPARLYWNHRSSHPGGAIWTAFPTPPTYIIFLELISLPIARSIMKVPVADASRFVRPGRESISWRSQSKSLSDAEYSIDVNCQYRYYPGGMEL